ncbi:MAG: hypothetical protein K2K46_11785 [Lachnospiraceae bacterium]|nr:hypothetical protein [Lachnospiraceae bacterium]
MKEQINSTTSNTVNQAQPATNGNIPAEKTIYSDMSIKELIAKREVQEAIRRYVYIPDIFTVKKLRNPFENKETKDKTQKIDVMSGTTIEDAVSFELTLLNTELNPKEAVNKKYRIIDCTFALEANMSSGKFGGYAAKGLKLMVTKLEEVK